MAFDDKLTGHLNFDWNKRKIKYISPRPIPTLHG